MRTIKNLRAAVLIAALFFILSMTELKTRHFIIIAIAIITSVAVYADYPLENLIQIYMILVGILAVDKGAAMYKDRIAKPE